VSDHAYAPKTAPLYRALVEGDAAPLRVRAYEVGRGDALSEPPGSGDDRFRLIGVKYWADGSPWQGNIAVSVPYLNTPVTLQKMGLPRDYHGSMNYTKEQIAEEVGKYFPQGYQFAIHAHGDLAIDAVLDVYEAQLKQTPQPDHRLRLEHCGCMRDEQFARAAALGVTVSLFMAHVYYWGDVLHDSLFPPEVADRWAAAGSALRAGVRISFHNDGFVSPTRPLLNIQTAVTRATRSGRVLGPEQAISVEQALRAQTIDAAYQLFMDDIVGSLETGKLADLVVLAENPLAVAPERIGAIAVEATYVGGVKVARPS
jgi:predicted amidohydrolase YtcJ